MVKPGTDSRGNRDRGASPPLSRYRALEALDALDALEVLEALEALEMR